MGSGPRELDLFWDPQLEFQGQIFFEYKSAKISVRKL